MAGEAKERARQDCDERGLPWGDRETIKSMKDRCREYDLKGGKTPRTRTASQTRTRAGSARSTVSRSGGSSGGSRARTAALAKSAPTVRMRVDERDLQAPRQPGSADIIAVALVVFLAVAAWFATPGNHKPRAYAPVVIVAQA